MFKGQPTRVLCFVVGRHIRSRADDEPSGGLDSELSFPNSMNRIGPSVGLADQKKPELGERQYKCFVPRSSRFRDESIKETRLSNKMFFDNVPRGPPDVMYHLKQRADNDLHPQKIDLGVGIYRNEHGAYHELQAVTQVWQTDFLVVRDKPGLL
jgi:hypothetical protein